MYWQLVKKELRIQRPAFLMAVGGLLFWTLLIAFPQVAPEKMNAFETADVVYFIHLVFVRSWLIALAPMMIGAAVIAEERRLGMWDWHLSLPVSRWTCLLVKILVAAGLALVLVGIVFPLAHMATQRILNEDSEWIPALIRLLAGREWNFWFPLILMFCAIYASSIVSESGKAFYIAIPLFGLIICAMWMPDPFGLMLAPWSLYEAEKEAIVTSYLPLLVAILCGILGIFAYWNFHYAPVKWRKILLQLTLLIISTAVATAITLHLQMSPMGLITQDIEKVKPLAESWGRREIDWTGIRPLAARRIPPGFGIGEKRFRNFIQKPDPIADLHPFPKHGVMVLEMNSINVLDKKFSRNQYVVVDKKTRDLTPLVLFAGSALPTPDGLKLSVHDDFGLSPIGRLAISEFQDDILLQELFKWPSRKSRSESRWGQQWPASVTIDNNTYEGLSLRVPAGNIFTAFLKERNQIFILRKENDDWSVIDEYERGLHFDPEGRWLADKQLARSNGEIVIRSVDGQITRTLSAANGAILLLAETSLNKKRAGFSDLFNYLLFSVSFSGRYLPYLFTPVRVGSEKAYEPVSELRILDLLSGEMVAVDHFQTNVDEFYEGSFYWSSQREDKSWDLKTIHSAWSPEKDELAILLNDYLHVYRIEAKGRFALSDLRNLEGFDFDHIDYWGGDTLLAWGQLGLFEIDLKN